MRDYLVVVAAEGDVVDLDDRALMSDYDLLLLSAIIQKFSFLIIITVMLVQKANGSWSISTAAAAALSVNQI